MRQRLLGWCRWWCRPAPGAGWWLRPGGWPIAYAHFHNLNPLPANTGEVLARYRQLREISKRHHHEILKHISHDTILHQARRLGLARGRTVILDDMEEMDFVFDLAIHTAPPGRSRAIDRYARSARLAAPSDEALVLEAMRAARFSILRTRPSNRSTASKLISGCCCA